ncbi:hypothetical protein [uncultured Flavobacterium sp.]|uniref:hypothetical protein n=1 Tax=uncultured Flavobacterium sp. TaxID=165435 RepID=UPI00259719B2|nr:hypothetical protein [uncultured Flavobacterium sp.]
MIKYNELKEVRYFGSLTFLAEDLKLEVGDNKKYLVCVTERFTGVTWAELTDNIIEFSYIPALKVCLYCLRDYYNIEFKELCTDNNVDFRDKYSSYELDEMMLKLNIAHSYENKHNSKVNNCELFCYAFRSYMLNKKIESLEDFKEKLKNYLLYYNKKKIAE